MGLPAKLNMKRKVQIVILSSEDPKDPELLILKTNKERGSFWQNVTGSVDDEESFQEAAMRELAEETGINLDNAKKFITPLESEFFFIDRKERHVHEMVYVYHGPKWDIQMCEEHVEYSWVNASSLPRDQYKYESNYQAVQKALEKISV